MQSRLAQTVVRVFSAAGRSCLGLALTAGLCVDVAHAQPADPLAAPPPAAATPPATGLPAPPSALTFSIPDFVVPGARFIYSGSFSQRVQPDNRGVATSTGAGMQRLDVIAVTDSMVLLGLSSYASTGNGGRMPAGSQLVTRRASDPLSGTAGALWVSQEALAALREAPSMKAADEQWPINGRVYDATVLTREAPDGAQRYAYDRSRGLLLGAQVATGQGQGFNRETSSVQVFQTYRAVTLPWFSAAPPAWLQTFTQLAYEGHMTMHGGVGPSITTPARMNVTVTERGPDWAILSSTVIYQGQPPATTPTATGPASIGGYWISPAALRSMAPGVLDRDATLGLALTYSVETAVDGSVGLLVESDTSNGFHRAFGYSLNDGTLVYMRMHNAAMGTTTEFRLVGRE